MIEVQGPPSRWIARHGRPADAVIDGGDWMPSYESDGGKILVYDVLLAMTKPANVNAGGVVASTNITMLFPRSYMMTAVLSVLVGDHELVALHDDPDASWSWRPLVYKIGDGLTRLGSQQEIEWRWMLCEARQANEDIEAACVLFVIQQTRDLRRRYGRLPPFRLEPGERGFRLRKNTRKRLYREYVAEVERLREDPGRFPSFAAIDRAEAILREHLCPHQRLDLEVTRGFLVRGTINRLYRVELGNGAMILDPDTHTPVVSLCLHPERWMPHADVALATKLAIESGPAREEEILAGARPRVVGRSGRGPTPGECAAWDRERELLPVPFGS